MNRLLKPTVASLAVLAVGMLGAYAQDDLEHVAPQQLTADRDGRLLRIEGNATALRVEVRRTTIADVLSALARFNIRYRSSTGLDEVLDGTYAGPLGQVVTRLLNGYDFAAKEDGLKLEVMIFGKRGEVVESAPISVPVRRRSSE
jgi:hypothetical protein